MTTILRRSPTIEIGSTDRSIALAITLFAVIVRFVVLRATRCTVEDSLITLRYAENLASCHGFVYNHGERVLGTTTPLFTLILSLFASLHLDALAIGKGMCILADGAVCYVLARLLARLGHPTAGLFAALLYATASAPINFSIGGMETALVTLAGLAAIYASAFRRGPVMAVCLAILVLLRIDGLLLAIVLLAAWWLQQRHPPWREFATFTSILAPWIAFATWHFGSPVPTSMVAKLTVYQHASTELLPNASALLHQFVGDAVHSVLFAVSFLGAIYAWRRYAEFRAPIVWWILYHVAMLVSRAPVQAFGWYFVPPLPVYEIMTVLGGAAIASWRPFVALRTREMAIAYGCLALITVGLGWNLRATARAITREQRVEDTLRRPLGLWLAAHAPPDSKILLESIGYIGYYSRRPILDMVGLVSPEVIPIYREVPEYPLGAIVDRFKPPILVIRNEERDKIRDYDRAHGTRIIDGEYSFVRRFPNDIDEPGYNLYALPSVKLK